MAGELREDSLVAVVVSSDLQRIGTFDCSDPMLNQLHRNVVWGQRGNFLDVPTDCPQRDERLGWTGDIAVFSPTAVFLFDAARSSATGSSTSTPSTGRRRHRRLRRAGCAQVRPAATGSCAQDSTSFWSDAAVWVPWAAWQAYGDRAALAEAFGAMAAHVRRVDGKLSDQGLWDSGYQFADWLDPSAPPDKPAAAKADPGVVSTAAIYRSAATTGKRPGRWATPPTPNTSSRWPSGSGPRSTSTTSATTAGCSATARRCTRWPSPSGCSTSPSPAGRGTVGGAGRAEQIPDRHRLRRHPYVTDALTATGHLDDAYLLLLERECPSWLYPVTMGATTIWERWDSMLPDGSINPGQMTSFNHYALGAVADWMHRTVAGLAPAEPGYRRVRVAPQPGGGLTWAKASLLTPHGEVRVAWEIVDGELRVEADLPEGVTAELVLPGSDTEIVTGGQSGAAQPPPLKLGVTHDHVRIHRRPAQSSGH